MSDVFPLLADPAWTGPLSILSFVVAVVALVLSYRKYVFDTKPIVIMRWIAGGIELENIGKGVATGVQLTLIERSRRSSAILRVDDLLRPGCSSTVFAAKIPDELLNEAKFLAIGSSEAVIRMHDDGLRPCPKRVACYVMTRSGSQRVIVRFREGDRKRLKYRIFKFVTVKGGPPEAVRCCHVLENCIMMFLFEKVYGKNQILGADLSSAWE